MDFADAMIKIHDTTLTGEEKGRLIGMCVREANMIRALNCLQLPIDVSILRGILTVPTGKD